MGQSLSLAKCTCNNTDVKAGIEYDNNNSNSSDQSYAEEEEIVAKVQKPAPDFECMGWYNGFKKIKLADYRGKYLVLFFYPLDFTFVCPTEICQFSDRSPEFREIGCEVIGASVDTHFTHKEYTMKDKKKGGLGKMKIPLLADVTKSISQRYGCLIEDGPDRGVSFRATYIIDGKGIVRHISISDLPVGRNVDEILRLVQAF
jgi:alkyl hydroperoxide reductase subunit AhpC